MNNNPAQIFTFDIFKLPFDIFGKILTDYLNIVDVGKFDAAVNNKQIRSYLLEFLPSDLLVWNNMKAVMDKWSAKTDQNVKTRISIGFPKWLALRRMQILNLDLCRGSLFSLTPKEDIEALLVARCLDKLQKLKLNRKITEQLLVDLLTRCRNTLQMIDMRI